MTVTRRDFMTGVGLAAGFGAGYLLNKYKPHGRPMPLRPPGAANEDEFLAACIRCEQCIEACPWNALKTGGVDAGLGIGAPYLIPRHIPCYLCEDLDGMKCIEACPTSALSEPPDLKSISMGTAVVDKNTCSAFIGAFCKACAEACPIPGAIVLDENRRPIVRVDACVGCGICEHVCPTDPTSIRIRPAAEKAS